MRFAGKYAIFGRLGTAGVRNSPDAGDFPVRAGSLFLLENFEFLRSGLQVSQLRGKPVGAFAPPGR
jgi:hypothetical protein